MKSRTPILLLGLVVLMVLGAFEVFTGPTIVHQLLNMRRARQYLPVARQTLGGFPEFRQLRMVVFTDAGGSLLVSGFVSSKSEADHLKNIIDYTKPPIQVVYMLDIGKHDRF